MTGFVQSRLGSPRDSMADPVRLAAIGAQVRTRLEEDKTAQDLGRDRADLFLLPDLLSPQECRRLIRTIDRRLGPSELFEGTRIEGFRTSSTHYFDADDSATQALETRIHQRLGIAASHAEVTQGQRYRQGQQFKHHYDYFTLTEGYWQQERRRGGQRSWTAMVFLNAPDAGGATDFPELGLSVTPRPGAVLAWNNMDRDGYPNPATLHAGLPVTRGSKYVITQWYRQEAWSLSLR